MPFGLSGIRRAGGKEDKVVPKGKRAVSWLTLRCQHVHFSFFNTHTSFMALVNLRRSFSRLAKTAFAPSIVSRIACRASAC